MSMVDGEEGCAILAPPPHGGNRRHSESFRVFQTFFQDFPLLATRRLRHHRHRSIRVIRRISLLAALAFACAPLYATTYTLEPQHSQGIVRWNHLGFANPTAQFTMVEGSVDFDQADPTRSSVSVTIPLAHLSSGIPDLDDDFRSDHFFDMARYPVATFKSTRVERGSAPGKLKVTGDFTVHGITRQVALDVTINKLGNNIRRNLESIGFEAITTLKRSDFGLGRFVPQVSDEVSIHITCQGDEAKAYAKELQEEAAEDAKAAAAKGAVQK
jgi:polyisoprenoid-binding protein YceI